MRRTKRHEYNSAPTSSQEFPVLEGRSHVLCVVRASPVRNFSCKLNFRFGIDKTFSKGPFPESKVWI
jgi:hypothetical protein